MLSTPPTPAAAPIIAVPQYTQSAPMFAYHQRQQLAPQGIRDPCEHDVLCGRGVSTAKHHGNVHFRDLVSKNKELYVSETKKGKMMISRSIVSMIRAQQSPPGRFLELDKESKLWVEIGDKKAIEKTSQALRDEAAPLRKQLKLDMANVRGIGEEAEDAKDDPQKRPGSSHKRKVSEVRVPFSVKKVARVEDANELVCSGVPSEIKVGPATLDTQSICASFLEGNDGPVDLAEFGVYLSDEEGEMLGELFLASSPERAKRTETFGSCDSSLSPNPVSLECFASDDRVPLDIFTPAVECPQSFCEGNLQPASLVPPAVAQGAPSLTPYVNSGPTYTTYNSSVPMLGQSVIVPPNPPSDGSALPPPPVFHQTLPSYVPMYSHGPPSTYSMHSGMGTYQTRAVVVPPNPPQYTEQAASFSMGSQPSHYL